jgi:hypothetical protein
MGNKKKNWVNVEDTADITVRLLNGNNIPSGIYTVTSKERWSWKDIVCVMQKMYYEKYGTNNEPFNVTYPNILHNTIGDPINLHVSGAKLDLYYVCNRSVETAVREALLFLGWTQ